MVSSLKGLVVIALAWTTAVAANVLNRTALAELPTCVKSCSARVLPMYSCTAEEPCFCESEQIETSMSACLEDSGCSFDDQLAAMKFQAETCGERTRDRGPLLSGVTYTLFGVATLFTIARAISRWPKFGGAGFGLDDYTAFVAYTLLTAMTAGNWFAIHCGKGRYIYTLSANSVSLFLMWFYICNILYSVAIFLTKISLVLLYLRVWARAKDETSRFTGLCLLALFGLVATMTSFTIVCIAQCIPVSYVWTFIAGGAGSCIDRTSWVWALSGTEIAWDLIVILLPIPKLLRLEVSIQRKIGICSVFLVGLVVMICSFVRLEYISGFTMHKNFTYFYSYIGLWSSIEAYLSQVCCCMPAMAGSVRRIASYINQPRRRSALSSHSQGATVVSGTQFDMFDLPSTGSASDDTEKASTSKKSSSNRSQRSQDSVPSPVTPLQPGQRNAATLSPPPKHPSRAFVTTHHNISDSSGAPDILYHDHMNDVRFEVIDPPESPIRAQLRYIDRDQRYHDVELQGVNRRPSTPRPPSRRAMRSFPRPMSPDLVPFSKAKPSWDTLNE